MFGGIFVMKIKPGHREHLIEALKEHGRAAKATEPGLRRFDIYPDTMTPTGYGSTRATWTRRLSTSILRVRLT